MNVQHIHRSQEIFKLWFSYVICIQKLNCNVEEFVISENRHYSNICIHIREYANTYNPMSIYDINYKYLCYFTESTVFVHIFVSKTSPSPSRASCPPN